MRKKMTGIFNPLASIQRAMPVDEWRRGTSPHEGRTKNGSRACPWGSRKGQSVLEYAVLISALCAVFLTMMVYMKNAVYSKFFVIENRINEESR